MHLSLYRLYSNFGQLRNKISEGEIPGSVVSCDGLVAKGKRLVLLQYCYSMQKGNSITNCYINFFYMLKTGDCYSKTGNDFYYGRKLLIFKLFEYFGSRK